MRIQSVNNSEIFNIYSSAMSKYINKRAGAGKDLIREIPSFSDELARSGAVSAKAVLNNSQDFLDIWRNLYKGDFGVSDSFLDAALLIINSGTDPRLKNPEFVSKMLDEVTTISAQFKKVSDAIEPPVTKEQMQVWNQILDPATAYPNDINELIVKYTNQLPIAQKAFEDSAALVAANTKAQQEAAQAALQSAEEAKKISPQKPVDASPLKSGDITAEPVSKVVKEVAQEMGEESVPAAKIEAQALAEDGKSLGQMEGMLEALSALKSQREGDLAASKSMKDSLTESISDLKKELVLKIADSKIADKKSLTDMVQEVRKLSKGDVVESAASMTAGENAKAGAKEWIRDAFKTGKVASMTLKTAGLVAAATLVLGGVWYMGEYLNSDPDSSDQYQLAITRLQDAINRAKEAHTALSFKDLTSGADHNEHLLQELEDNIRSGEILSAENLSDPNNFKYIVSASEQLDELNSEVKAFMGATDEISESLESYNGWEDAKAADIELLDSIKNTNTTIKAAIQKANSSGFSRDVQGPQQSDVSASGPIGDNASETEQIIDIYGTKIDISKKPAGFRSAVHRMKKRLLESPYGMAFLDPENKWGGFIRKTGNPQVDYLNSLGYLYKEGVFTPSQLRKFIRHALPKHGRRRYSGWKNAVKSYRRNPFRAKTASKLSNNISIPKESTNRFEIGMSKKANQQYSNQYISDAISGLSDQYAKSYYAGLKSQYNSKPAKMSPDYKDLYEVHKEKGSDLIQEAHPKAVIVSDSIGNGGLVENLLEQQSHSEGVAKRAPTGNFRGRRANIEVVKALSKIAGQAYKSGLFEVSDLIDSSITNILNK